MLRASRIMDAVWVFQNSLRDFLDFDLFIFKYIMTRLEFKFLEEE